MLAASPRTPRLRYAGSAEFSLMAHAWKLVDQFHRKRLRKLFARLQLRVERKAAPRERFVFGIEHLQLACSTKAIFHVGRLRDAPQQ